jgi:hypothetical protein
MRMEEEKKDEHVLEIQDGRIGFEEIIERARRRAQEEVKKEEVKDNGETST